MTVAFEMIDVGGVRLRAALLGHGPLVVLVHGFPESWYSWRHQMTALADAGYRACAIDARGYGGSDKPYAVEAYDLQSLTGDVAGVIAALSPTEPSVVIGHDWGAPIAWTTAMLHPERVRAVAALSVPHTAQPPIPLIDIFRAVYTARNRFFYQVYFQDEGIAEAEFEADTRTALRKLWYDGGGERGGASFDAPLAHGQPMLPSLVDPDPFPAWLGAADIDYYVGEFERSGFRGPINRYRNFERDHAFLIQRPDQNIYQPALFIAGDRDLVLRMVPGADLVAGMRDLVPNLRGVHLLPGIGHWVQQEAPEAVSRLLIDWLNGLPTAA